MPDGHVPYCPARPQRFPEDFQFPRWLGSVGVPHESGYAHRRGGPVQAAAESAKSSGCKKSRQAAHGVGTQAESIQTLLQAGAAWGRRFAGIGMIRVLVSTSTPVG